MAPLWKLKGKNGSEATEERQKETTQESVIGFEPK